MVTFSKHHYDLFLELRRWANTVKLHPKGLQDLLRPGDYYLFWILNIILWPQGMHFENNVVLK